MQTATETKTTGRKKSKLTRIGDAEMRRVLFRELVKHDWHLSQVAEELELGGPANVIRAIHALGLSHEYDKARKTGKIKRGVRPA